MSVSILEDLNVLYVEDEERIRQNSLAIFSQLNLNVITACNGQEGVDKFHQHKIDIIITDISMPIMCGLTMLEKLKQDILHVPVIITANRHDINLLHETQIFNISGFLLKPFLENQMTKLLLQAFEPAFLRHQIQQKEQQIIQLNKSIEKRISVRTKKLEKLATLDSLTGINNRRSFFELSKRKFEKKNEKKLFAAMIDLDNFKRINDTYGHAIGDEVLKLISKTINKSLKTKDVFGRIGGEEFALLFHTKSHKKAHKKLEAIRHTIENTHFMNEQCTIACTISNGLAKRHKNDSLDSLLSRADKALYQAKGKGKNRVILFRH